MLAGLLSYAEQRALEIGITIAGGASVILLDEPTAGMSHSETEYAVALIRRVTEGKTLLMVEHDMRVVFGLADTITVLVYGEVIASDAPADMRASQSRRCRKPISGALGQHDARRQGPARLLRQEPHPARRRPDGRRRRDRQPAGPQRRRPLDHLQGHHGPGGADRLGPLSRPGHRRPAANQVAQAGIGYVPEDRQIFPDADRAPEPDARPEARRPLRPLEFRRRVPAVSAPGGAPATIRPACCPAASSRC